MSLISKLPQVGTTIFTIMSRMAQEENAINLAQGFPGFGSDPILLELVAKFTRDGNNQYAPMSGVSELKLALATKTQRTQGYFPDPESEVTIVSGATEALFSALSAVVRPGDEVLVLEPSYDSYVPGILLNGGIPVFVALNPTDFSVDWELVASKITDKTRAIVVNSPHNPSGQVWSKEDVAQLASLVSKSGIFVISDEVYEHILFDGKVHHSLGSHPELRERTFVCGSFGKTFHVTGWKIGYCIAPVPLSQEFRKIHQYVTFSTVTPIQFALAEYLDDPKHYLNLPSFYQKKRDLFVEGLKSTPFNFQASQGSFFQLVSYAHLSKKSDVYVAEQMTRKLKVACIPVSVFYSTKQDHQVLRFCFAKKEEELEEALRRIQKIATIF
ncbi:MAG: methionine aminotransferase [Algoriphagus sp.]|jgi:methionine transaminase|uniref:methionine aminotransferase n=1 Tax=Algoriphagus sp. TaxID=1872435 RepID=UPI002768ABE1|nr:methionine aminotransferase [Algoriphagus sp.]MDP4747809.1 methionine aminotransferase [Algoriphagus sp.]MDP4838171.1 methionine aminotransferase [Algoriphagus sp.]MDP4903371.1 methionine aminotransferase [Algoriphagus sp.]MDP4956621.1 methionine aminotransferase [Algoriphagus sp.]